MTHKVTIFAITEHGVRPQFFAKFGTKSAADAYARDFRKLAAKAGVMIRIDRDQPADQEIVRGAVLTEEVAHA